MQGPTGGRRPYMAGGRAGSPGNSPDGVRDWQRNTWYGPAPLNTNPFDEPEDAPELKESRSENVNEHIGSFWEPQGTGFIPRTEANPGGTARAGAAKKTKKTDNTLIRVLIGVFVFLLAVVLILRFAVFSVREISVTGNSSIPESEIIRESGIHPGDFILTLDEKAVERRIAGDYRLLFRYVAKQMPNRVVISVREREMCCWLNYCGIMYIMDKNRMVLFESENPADRPADLVEVKGLEVRSNTLVGQVINLGSEIQQSIFSELFLEMKVLGCTARIAEADISNPDSILLATRDGYTIGLGGRENLHAKLRSTMLVIEELNRQGYQGGTINVVNPEKPIFTP